MLCEKCIPMFQGPNWGDHHPNSSSLIEAAENGCCICKVLLQDAVNQSGDIQKPVVAPWTYRVYKMDTGDKGAQIIVDMNESEDETICMETEPKCLSMMVVPSSVVAINSTIRNRSSSLPLLEATETAKRWLSECIDGHDRCQKNTQPTSYPERLLELGESSVKVILPAEENISGPYAALSYCWGSNPTFLRLSDSNLNELRNGIPFAELPIAFQEAIDVVKSLSIRYLWIDALCTMNPGPESPGEYQLGWSRKEEVYSNSILSLSLARAGNPHESCLGGCPPHAKLPFQVETSGIFGDMEKCSGTVVFWDFYNESLFDQPLGFRGWGLRERIFPPRVLSLGLGQLFWDCIQLPNACESLPCGPAHLASEFNLRQKVVPQTSDKKKLEEFWWQIWEEYTSCELTYPESDKLVGLSAIANQVATAMDDVYVVGHFWKTLPFSLCWKTRPTIGARERNGKKARRIVAVAGKDADGIQHQIPSWSWASMDGPLYISRVNEKYASLANAETYESTPVNSINPSEQTYSVKLKISTRCVEIEWTPDRPTVLHELWAKVGKFYMLKVDMDDENITLTTGSRYLLAALLEDDRLREWQGLVLKEVEIEGEIFYQRIGSYFLCNLNGESHRSEWREDFQTMFGERKMITLA